jgi:hypothetical protein
MKKELFVSGLILIIVGLILSSGYNISVYVESYVLKNSVVNTFEPGSQLENSISGYFEAGERVFFNFSRGRYWGGSEEMFEPGYSTWNFSIPEYKTVSFEIYTPSNDVCEFQALVVYGENPYVIIFYKESEDFTHLPDGNLTFLNVGVEGIVNKNGTYTIKAVCIDPPVSKTRDEPPLSINEDPPMEMDLWTIKNMETKPYHLLLPMGIFLASFGIIISIWGTIATKKRKRLLKSHYRKLHR